MTPIYIAAMLAAERNAELNRVAAGNRSSRVVQSRRPSTWLRLGRRVPAGLTALRETVRRTQMGARTNYCTCP